MLAKEYPHAAERPQGYKECIWSLCFRHDCIALNQVGFPPKATLIMSKLLVVIGATGNQGGSVVSHFLSYAPSKYRIRGLTRDTSSTKAKALASKGVELVAADLDDVPSLVKAFKDADVIFGVTDFWAPYFDPRNANKGKENGTTRNAWAYQYELQQGTRTRSPQQLC
jgi:hypothetical protein